MELDQLKKNIDSLIYSSSSLRRVDFLTLQDIKNQMDQLIKERGDFFNFLEMYLSQSVSLEDLDHIANILIKKIDSEIR